MCVGLNIYIDDNLMFTELSSRERVSVCENMHLSDNLHFTDSRRRTSMYLLGVNHLLNCKIKEIDKNPNFWSPGTKFSKWGLIGGYFNDELLIFLF